MEEKFIRDIAILWATIDPISTLLLFSSLTASAVIQLAFALYLLCRVPALRQME